MCDLTVAAIALGVGTAVNIAGSIASGIEKDKQLGFAIGQAQSNAALLGQAAGDAVWRGGNDAMRPLLEGGAAVSAQRGRAGASGLSVNSSQVVALNESSRAMARFDANTVLNNAWREAWGLQQQSNQYLEQATQYQTERDALPFTTLLGVTGSAAHGVAQGYSMKALTVPGGKVPGAATATPPSPGPYRSGYLWGGG